MKDQLKTLYIDKELSLEKVGKLLGVSPTTIYRRLKKHNIKIRNSGELNKGKPSGASGKTWKLSEKARNNHRLSLIGKKQSLRHRINQGLARRGLLAKEKNPNWRGGITKQNDIVRKSFDYRMWRNLVFERDNYTCQICGKKGGILHAHHIKPFAYYPELRFLVDNGETLCVDCHKKTNTYAGRGKIYGILT
ncbi:MAG: HNH endonuclease [Prolixibacteraceae bacterium]|nr:HNH endonuclease [Prolixibacteraceae bacterium]